VAFVLDGQRFGLPLSRVRRVIPSVSITPLPGAPAIVAGAINLRGQVIPVIDLRRRLGLPERSVALDDRFVIASTARRTLALVADAVPGVLPAAAEIVAPDTVLPGLPHVAGIAKLDDGLVLIHDLERFLSLDEEHALDRALGAAAS
jgi:purine-binding chemotaxis protein CheW